MTCQKYDTNVVMLGARHTVQTCDYVIMFEDGAVSTISFYDDEISCGTCTAI